MFSTIPEAARGLLGEACTIANKSNLRYAVCGGWSPYLRNSGKIPHPGTKDVDLLFSQATEVGALREVLRAFLEAGYLPSAKHEFQLLRLLKVDKQNFVFNVDFLHPTEPGNTAPLFVDHLDITTSTGEPVFILAKGKSISLPDSQIVFEGDLAASEELNYTTAAGEPALLTLPLLDEVGLLVTKSKSCSSSKRHRDLFDIYLAIKQARDPNALRLKLSALKATSQGPFESLSGIRRALDPQKLTPDVKACFQRAGTDPITAVQEIAAFLDEMGVPLPNK
jgi:hypothetical protein